LTEKRNKAGEVFLACENKACDYLAEEKKKETAAEA